jgi:hypothetical protein
VVLYIAGRFVHYKKCCFELGFDKAVDNLNSLHVRILPLHFVKAGVDFALGVDAAVFA